MGGEVGLDYFYEDFLLGFKDWSVLGMECLIGVDWVGWFY